ncbi:hypothetical protein ADUPG1_000601, partial [Aduncisulcus paluster]
MPFQEHSLMKTATPYFPCERSFAPSMSNPQVRSDSISYLHSILSDSLSHAKHSSSLSIPDAKDIMSVDQLRPSVGNDYSYLISQLSQAKLFELEQAKRLFKKQKGRPRSTCSRYSKEQDRHVISSSDYCQGKRRYSSPSENDIKEEERALYASVVSSIMHQATPSSDGKSSSIRTKLASTSISPHSLSRHHSRSHRTGHAHSFVSPEDNAHDVMHGMDDTNNGSHGSNRVGRSHNHDAEDSSGSSGDDDEKERARIMKGGPSTLKTRYRDVVPITARNKKDIFHGVFRDDEHIQQFLDTIPVDDTPGVNGVDYEDMADFILEHGVLNAQRKTVDPALGPDPPAWSFSLPS